MIETSINKNLVEKGSVGKFLFKDAQDRWFITYKNEGQLKVHYLKNGFWPHFDDVFLDNTKIYESKDILFPGISGYFRDVVNRFYVSLRRISKSINKNKFRNQSKNE